LNLSLERSIAVKTPDTDSPSERLPLTHSLTLAYVLSLVVAVAMAVVSVAGILKRTLYYPEEVESFFIQDWITLAAGLPLLLGSMWLARRGKLIGLLLWPGMLFSMVYNYAFYLIVVPLNALFLAYLVLVTVSAYTIIGIVASIDGEAVRQRLIDAVPARVSGGILAGLSIFIILRVVALSASALTGQTPVGMLTRLAWIIDFTVGCPALLVCGILLWRRKALGYVAGAGLFLQYSLLAAGLVPVMVYNARAAALPVDVAGIVVVLIMVVICLVPLVFFVRGAVPGRGSSPA
jgi:hypothetical protein